MTISPGFESSRPRLAGFFVVLFILAALRIGMGYVALPERLVPVAGIVVTILFMTLPIYALYLAARHPWSLISGIVLVVSGVVIQFGGAFLAAAVKSGPIGGALFAFSQIGLIVWCLGLGVSLAYILRDKNMLLPIALFLALFDMWLVFAPEGMVGQVARGNQATLQQVAFAIPEVAVAKPEVPREQVGFARPSSFVGPADLFFLGMFFVALYRFKMRTKETFQLVVPVLIAYMIVVLTCQKVWLGPIRLSALPALLPIGLVVLWVNRREFKLIRDEKIITVAILVLGAPFVAWRIVSTQPENKPQPETPVAAPIDPKYLRTYEF